MIASQTWAICVQYAPGTLWGAHLLTHTDCAGAVR